MGSISVLIRQKYKNNSEESFYEEKIKDLKELGYTLFTEDELPFTPIEWEEITEEVFMKIFHESPLQRRGFEGLKRNLKFTLQRDERLD